MNYKIQKISVIKTTKTKLILQVLLLQNKKY